MAIPTVRAVGTIAASAGAISPGLPAGTAVGDLLVMICETAAAITASGWVVRFEVDGPGGVTRLTVLSRVATGTDPTTTSDSGNHNIGRIIGITTGTFNPTTPFHLIGAGNTQTTTTSVSITGITTTVNDCLILACSASDLPDADSTTEFSSAANASLSSVVEQIDNASLAGNGGAILLISGGLATAGASGTTTATAANTGVRSNVTIAVGPVADVTGTIAVTEENDASAIAAVENIPGAVAATEDADTSAFAGLVANPITGTIAYTEEDDTPTISGDSTSPAVSGTSATTEQDDTASFAGTVTPPAVTGTISTTEADDTATFSGNSTVPGTMVTTEQDDIAAFTGVVAAAVTGTSTTTEGDDTGSFVGLISTPGTITTVEGDDGANFVGVVGNPIIGVLAGVEADDVALFVGSTTGGVIEAMTVTSTVSTSSVSSTVSVPLVESEVQ